MAERSCSAFPKKGDLGSASNYRGITLMAVGAKIYNRVLHDRPRPILTQSKKDQNGFRKGMSTVAQILTSRRGNSFKKIPATITFVDFEKAVDSIYMRQVMEILKAYGVPVEIVYVINTMYTSTTAQVLSSDRDTDMFEILPGVLQGDGLEPYLFIITLDYTMG